MSRPVGFPVGADRRREVPLDDHDAPTPGGGDPGGQPGPSTGLVGDPDLLAALRALPRRQREVIALRLFLDLGMAATAAVLGIAPGTVVAHKRRPPGHP